MIRARLSLMGGLVAGVLILALYVGLGKRSLSRLADCFLLPAGMAIILLKLSCFLNGCCCGKSTDSP